MKKYLLSMAAGCFLGAFIRYKVSEYLEEEDFSFSDLGEFSLWKINKRKME